MPPPERIHATAIVLDRRAALIRGPSGSGKSDLALRCLALAPTPLLPATATLLADDYVELAVCDGRLEARAPATIRGQLEVRGVGIVTVEPALSAEAVLLVDLVGRDAVPRLPDPIPRETLMGVSLPVLRLAPFETSSPIKLLLALASGYGWPREN